MGTGLRFLEAGRAAYIAKVLQVQGYGVLWEPEHPEVIMTSAGKAQVKQVSKAHRGVLGEWWNQGRIDC